MKVRFLREWKGYRIGRVIDPPRGQADLMLRRGIVELADPKPPLRTFRKGER